MSNDNKQDKKLAVSIDLLALDTEQAVRPIMRDILYTMYNNPKTSQTRRKQIEDVYAGMYPGATLLNDGKPIQSTSLFGPPGNGKTTAFKVAARKVASALGMRYLENGAADAEENITDNDFVFITQETAGVATAIEWGGLPTAEAVPGTDIRRMGRLHSGALIKLQQAGGGVLLLDDFLNANPNIQNVGLSLTEEKRYNRLNLQGVYIGITGNLGSLDGTHTARPSTALRNRTKVYYTEDKLDNWAARVQIDYNDELSDMGLIGFLQKFPQYFCQDADIKKFGGFATPRSWERLLEECRRVVAEHGGRGHMDRAVTDLRIAACSAVGLTIGAELTTYFHSLATSADPLARAVIVEGRLDEEAIKKQFDNGFAASQQHFGYQYSLALADYAVVMMVAENKGNKIQKAAERFFRGIMHLNNPQLFSFAVDALAKKMAARLPELSENVSANERQLTHANKEALAKIAAENPAWDGTHREVIIKVLSGVDKFSNTSARRARRPGS